MAKKLVNLLLAKSVLEIAFVGTLAVVGPAYRFQAERIDKELAPLVLKAGRDLSSRLGFDVGRREAS